MGLACIGILPGIAGWFLTKYVYVVLERLAVLHTPSFNDMAVFLLNVCTKMGFLRYIVVVVDHYALHYQACVTRRKFGRSKWRAFLEPSQYHGREAMGPDQGHQDNAVDGNTQTPVLTT